MNWIVRPQDGSASDEEPLWCTLGLAVGIGGIIIGCVWADKLCPHFCGIHSTYAKKNS